MELQPKMGLWSNWCLDTNTDNPVDIVADGIYSSRLLIA